METIGKRLRYLRDKHKLTQEKMAELIGKKKGNISNYESDNYEPSAQTIIAICKIFNVSADWLLFGEERVSKSEHSSDMWFGFEIAPEDIELLAKFHQLSEKQQGIIVGRIEEMLSERKAGSSRKESSRSKNTGREEAAANERSLKHA